MIKPSHATPAPVGWEDGKLPVDIIAELIRTHAKEVGAGQLAEMILATLPTPAAPADAVEGWQPIETAPRDGTRILARDEDNNHFALEWDENGYWCCFCGQYVTQAPAPTHWRPLPAPPAIRARGEG